LDATIIDNLTNPAVLFFFLGALLGGVRSNLEIPSPIAKFLSLYLLMAIGFKGGQALAQTGLGGDAAKVLGAAMLLAVVVPAWSYAILRARVQPFDAAGIAATYGSVSAVTFVAASEFVASRGDAAGGHLTVALVAMESPAIVMAVLLATWVRTRHAAAGSATQGQPGVAGPDGAPGAVTATASNPRLLQVLHEAFTDGAHLLLIGSLAIGAVSGSAGGEAMTAFVGDIFTGVLAFFLLEMGLLVARQLREVRDVGPFLIAFGLAMPVVNAAAAMALGTALGLPTGDLTLLAVLAASASYIVVPAVIRYAIPEARPGRYFTMALAVTFPFNIIVGIPLYYAVAARLSA
jgi:hypothetical protein